MDQPKNYFNSQIIYHSPTSLDAKLDSKSRKYKPEFKEHNNNSLPPSEETKLMFANGINGAASLTTGKANIFPSRIKEESGKQENQRKRSASSGSNNYKEKKRKKTEALEEAQPVHQPTNHDRLQMDDEPKQPVKRVYVSYFERNNEDMEMAETRFVSLLQFSCSIVSLSLLLGTKINFSARPSA